MDEATESVGLLELTIIAMLGMFFLAGAIIVFFIMYQRRLLVQQAAHQRELLRASLESQEREQQRMARELHDGAGVMISTTQLYLQQLRMKPDSPQSGEWLTRAENLLNDTVGNIVAIAQNLQPAELESLGLAGALQELVRRMESSERFTFQVQLQPVPDLAPERALLLYRMAQELLNNAFKHAQATTHTVTLSTQGQTLTLLIADDGVGFDPEHLPHTEKRQGMGLKTLESRANLLGGNLVRKSAPGQGTQTTITAPLSTHTP
ncbi:MAG: sensor histidine kinase [Bacteroidota bacterium]